MANSHYQNTSPQVSIIIPSYNGEKYIQQAIDSVLNQSFQDFEIVISDDASADHTKEMVHEYIQESRISFFQNSQRLGIGDNWNQGIEKSTGKYIKILCQDDILKIDYLKEVVEVLENDSSVSLVTTFEQFLGDSNKVRNENDIPFLHKTEGQKIQNSVIKKGNWIGGPTAVTFRREDLTVGMFDTSLACGLDYEMWLRLLSEGDLYVIPEILYQSRIHKAQATSGCERNLGFDKDRIRILNKIQEYPQMYRGMDSETIQRSMEKSIQIYINKSLKNSEISLFKMWNFLYQTIGFPRSVKSLIKGSSFLSFNKVRQAFKP